MKRRPRRSNFSLAYSPLETKRLLAGNVDAFIDGTTLRITGDSLDNQIVLTQTPDGNTVVTGLDTTINGQGAPFTTDPSVNRVTMSLEGGDDEVDFEDYSISRNIFVFGGDGNDVVTLNNTEAGYVHLQGNDGDDVIELNGVIDLGSTYVFLGDGDDVLSIASLQTRRNFKVFGGGGDDTFASAELSVGRKFRLNLDNGNDQALLAGNTTVQKNTKIRLGNGDDFLGVLPQQTDQTSVFQRRVKLTAGAGDDVVAFDAGVTSQKSSRFVGNSGNDSINTGDANIDRRTRIRRFENTSISSEELASRIDDLYARLDAVGIDTALFGDTINEPVDPLPDSDLELDLASTTLSFTENDPPLNIDSSLTISGADVESVTSAVVQVIGGSDGEDQLLFDDTNGISGIFDSSTGTLSLIGSASPADYQAALRAVRFSNDSDDPTTDERTVTISLTSDLTTAPVIADRRIQITAVDDPLQLTLPGDFGGQTPILVNLNETITFTADGSDPDNDFVYQLDLDGSGISATAQQPTIDSATGEFSWSPSETGTFPIRVIVTNDIGDSDQEEFTATVI